VATPMFTDWPPDRRFSHSHQPLLRRGVGGENSARDGGATPGALRRSGRRSSTPPRPETTLFPGVGGSILTSKSSLYGEVGEFGENRDRRLDDSNTSGHPAELLSSSRAVARPAVAKDGNPLRLARGLCRERNAVPAKYVSHAKGVGGHDVYRWAPGRRPDGCSHAARCQAPPDCAQRISARRLVAPGGSRPLRLTSAPHRRDNPSLTVTVIERSDAKGSHERWHRALTLLLAAGATADEDDDAA
jgi:hypothetical protein